ncbi:MAG: ABC transporter ATP-binding protein [Bacteroidetes bacterium]|nr:ABC transporter ATP-binding protein [Bacteroidota bacterium]
MKLLFDEVGNESPWNKILVLIGVFGGLQILQAIFTQVSTYYSGEHQQIVTDFISQKVLKQATAVPYIYYETPSYHNTLHLAQMQSIYRIPQVWQLLNTAVLQGVSLALLGVYFFTLHFWISITFILICIPLAIVKWYAGYQLMRLEGKLVEKERESGYLFQLLSGFQFAKDLRILSFGKSLIPKFQLLRQSIRNSKSKLQLKIVWLSLSAELVEILIVLFLIGFLIKEASLKQISIGLLVISLQGLQRLQSGTRNFLQAMVSLFQQRLFLKDLLHFLAIPINQHYKSIEHWPNFSKGLVLENIGFQYEKSEKKALNHINLSCKPGEMVAIVGENGSGKSTLVKLLARLYQPNTGEISIDGINYQTITEQSLRNESIFLFQDIEKYQFTIAENISLGISDPDQQKLSMQHAAEFAGASAYIQKLPAGYDTKMGSLFTNSKQLSGGEWQKLAIARVFYRSPSLVVLDEPTSALDVLAEHDLFHQIKTQLKQSMVIIITHRLYNLKLADRIYVMKEGEIVESGNFADLLQNGGLFSRMYEKQKI